MFDAREYDAVVSTGENITAGLLALALQDLDVPARSWQGWQVPVRTNSAHGAARIDDIATDGIRAKFAEGMKVAVVAGFQGITEDHRISTLGRGGSDTSAVAFAAAFGRRQVRHLHGCERGLYRRPPLGIQGSQAQPGIL